MIDGSEKRKRQLVFERQSSRVYEKRSKLHAKTDIRDSCDIGFQVQFNAEFTIQVMDFP